mgnify:CR=1 FL=1
MFLQNIKKRSSSTAPRNPESNARKDKFRRSRPICVWRRGVHGFPGGILFQSLRNPNRRERRDGRIRSWERDFWQLTGKQRFLNGANLYNTGYISSTVSNGAGIFLSNPYIDVSFSTPHSMVGVTLQFDTVTGTAPLDFTVTAYENGAVKNTWSITGNTDVIYQGELELRMRTGLGSNLQRRGRITESGWTACCSASPIPSRRGYHFYYT